MATRTIAEAYDKEARGADLQESLAKIRHHTGSKLPNQRAPAQLLVAIESTLAEEDGQGAGASTSQRAQSSKASPTEYFMALEATLKRAAEVSCAR